MFFQTRGDKGILEGVVAEHVEGGASVSHSHYRSGCSVQSSVSSYLFVVIYLLFVYFRIYIYIYIYI